MYPTKYSAACCFLFSSRVKKTQSECGWWIGGLDQYTQSGADPNLANLCYRCRELRDLSAAVEELAPVPKVVKKVGVKSIKKPTLKKKKPPKAAPKKSKRKKSKK